MVDLLLEIEQATVTPEADCHDKVMYSGQVHGEGYDSAARPVVLSRNGRFVPGYLTCTGNYVLADRLAVDSLPVASVIAEAFTVESCGS